MNVGLAVQRGNAASVVGTLPVQRAKMGIEELGVNNIMSGIENTGGVKQHNHKKKLRQRFDIIKKLGQGTFGKVQLGINKETGQEVAIKTIKKSKIESDADLIRIRREIQIMSSVQHPNIIHIYEVFENREKMVLVMEYAAGGELYDYLSELKVLQEEEARRIFRQIATACYYCHKHKICHRDLKLENILLDENNNAKIADFGLSNVFDDQRLLSTFCGSPLYASPEIVKGTPYQGPEVDCWSLGVLLYTLVYGAMPFDGSNFKRLVKQISQGDYYEPAKPSPASPLIREMLTVNPKKRSSIEQICSHWWVNETYDVNCLDISEELANQTPVRLDVLLSLAPPAPQLESEKLVVTGDVAEEAAKVEAAGPTRSQSVGSLMELSNPERRILDLINEDKFTSKRKLESTLSTDRANLDKGRKDKIIKENTVADITVYGSIREDPSVEDASMVEAPPLNKSSTQTISKEMEVDPSQTNQTSVPLQKDPESSASSSPKNIKKDEPKANVSKPVAAKVKRTLSASVSGKILEGINEVPSQEHLPKALDKENQSQERSPEPEKSKTTAERSPVKKKIPKKSVLTDKNDIQKLTTAQEVPKETPDASKEKLLKGSTSQDNGTNLKEEKILKTQESIESTGEADSSKPIQRRRSRIFEAAEKFQSLISPTDAKPTPVEKPKKISIPGVSVGGFKKEFERKASLTSVSPPKLIKGSPVKKTLIDKQKSEESESTPEKETSRKAIHGEAKEDKKSPRKSPESETVFVPKEAEKTEAEMKKEKIKNAVSIISNALDKEGARKSKSKPCVTVKKPPMPFGVGGRSASGNIGTITPMTPLSPTIQNMGPKPFIRPCYEKKIASGETKPATSEVRQIKEESPAPPPNDEPQTSSAEITLKSATLPRRKTTKAQIQLNYPTPKPAQMEFKTEVAHKVEGPPQVRSEMVVPVSSPGSAGIRSSSIDSEAKGSKERIIPISFEKNQNGKEAVQSPPAKPPMARPFQSQKSNTPQRTSSLSRQSTQESDSEAQSVVGEPIKKSPREYIIPIAVEGGGYVTPRAGSLEPSDTASSASTITNRSKTKFGRARKLNSLLSERDSEDESPFSNLHRHSSFGKDSDTEDSRKDFHMHRLRSSRPKKATLEHNDSVSSGEEDDDDGFEILTAENLFSTLLSRVRDLTSRLNVDDEVRPGFPSRRLLSHFDHGTNFFNRIDSPLNRHSSLSKSFGRPVHSTSTGSSFGVPWRRSVSRDLASDIESVFNDGNNSATVRVPPGDSTSNCKNLNLADLDLKKLNLSEEDALALSNLTPGLSKRIQQQLLAELTPSQVRKLQRTLSSRTSDEVEKEPTFARRSADRLHSTLPRRSSVTRDVSEDPQELKLPTPSKNPSKSFLPVKYGSRSVDYHPSYDFNVRSVSTGAEPKGDYKFLCRRPRSARSVSARDSKIGKPDLVSPDSSISESLSSKNDETSASYSLSSRYSESSASRPYSKYSSDSSFLRYPPDQFSASNTLDLAKTDKKTSRRRISRFLRPDFFDSPKEDNVVEKEKKEREMETQKVLKEIRDKRKGRFRSASRDARSDKKEAVFSEDSLLTKDLNKKDLALSTNNQPAVSKIHDYVNTAPYVPEPVSKSYDSVNKAPQHVSKIHDYVNTAPYVPESTSNTNDCVRTTAKAVSKIHDYVNTAPYVPEHEYENTASESTSKIHDSVNTAPELVNTASHDFVNIRAQSQKESLSVPDSKTNKNLVNSTKALHDYVNVKMAESNTPNIRKERVSKIARPKSYPTEALEKTNKDNCDKKVCKTSVKNEIGDSDKARQSVCNTPNDNINDLCIPEKGIDNKLKTQTQSTEKETKISKIQKGFSRKEKPSKDDKNEANKTINEEDKGHKNKLLQSIEKKLEKFRSNNIAATKDPEEAKALLEKKSIVENAINRLREQSVPPVTPCTESNLIKRAVSVEDMAVGTKPLQTSRKSVTKILGLFKKYEEQDKKKGKSVKKLKPKDSTTSKEINGEKEFSSELSSSTCNNSEMSDKKERPKSLLYDKMKHFQVFSGARSDSVLNDGDKESKIKSKLPVTSFRRSLNLDNFSENPKHNQSTISENTAPKAEKLDLNVTKKPDRSNLKLDLTKTANKNVDPISIVINSVPGTSFKNSKNENRNSLTTTDDSSTIFSPTDDYLSCDSWSVCSDYHHLSDLNSPVYLNSHPLYSGDESESVIDRIRRKSFYTRFNDRRRPTRKPSLQSYKDLDLYKSDYGGKNDYGKSDYSSLDQYRSPSLSRRSSYTAYRPESASSTKEYKPYVRSVSALSDYANVPGSYQTYNSSRIGRPSVSRTLYSDSDTSHLDDFLQRSKRHISPSMKHRQPSINRVGSVSPVGEQYFLNRPTTSVVSPSTSEPI